MCVSERSSGIQPLVNVVSFSKSEPSGFSNYPAPQNPPRPPALYASVLANRFYSLQATPPLSQRRFQLAEKISLGARCAHNLTRRDPSRKQLSPFGFPPGRDHFAVAKKANNFDAHHALSLLLQKGCRRPQHCWRPTLNAPFLVVQGMGF